MSMSRFRAYRCRIRSLLQMIALILCGMFVLVSVSALAQGPEMAAGISIAEKMVGKSLAEGALVVAGLCVAGLCFVVRIAYLMHTDQMRAMIERDKAQTAADVEVARANAMLAGQIEALVVEMRRRPCMQRQGQE